LDELKYQVCKRVRLLATHEVPPLPKLREARRAGVLGFGVLEHSGDGSALPMLVQSSKLSLETWLSGMSDNDLAT
jgi:hypothetical protein